MFALCASAMFHGEPLRATVGAKRDVGLQIYINRQREPINFTRLVRSRSPNYYYAANMCAHASATEHNEVPFSGCSGLVCATCKRNGQSWTIERVGK